MSYFDCFQEELKMTLQIALIGRDGFVIASDSKAIRGGDPTGGGDYTMRISSETDKIVISQSGLVCALSGNLVYPTLVRDLMKRLEGELDPDPEVSLQSGIDAVFEDYELESRKRISGKLIIAIPGFSKLWEISFFSGTPLVSFVLNRSYGGDRGNPAVFFAERYLGDGGTEKSVEELKLLAAHTILEGHSLNPTGIGGLAMLVSKDGGRPYVLAADELQSLRDRSKSLHDMFASSIFLS